MSSPPHDKEMTIWEHLAELSKRLRRAFIIFLIGALIVWLPNPESLIGVEELVTMNYKPIASLIFEKVVLSQLPKDIKVIPTGPLTPLIIAVYISLLVGFIVAFPELLYEIYAYVKPALYPHELKIFKQYLILGATLFILGSLFSYFIVFPALMRLCYSWMSMFSLLPYVTSQGLLNTFFTIILLGGSIFETPIAMALLTFFGVVAPQAYKKYRIFAYLIGLAIIALINPDPSLASTFLFFIPFVILYEFGILLAKKTERSRLERGLEQKYRIE